MKQDIFFETACLNEKTKSLSGLSLQKKWFKSRDKRYLNEVLHKFCQYNKSMFDFLEISPIVEGYGKSASISFKTGKYVGAIPLKSPDTGKQIGDFVIKPRFSAKNNQFSDYAEILNLIKDDVAPEFKSSIPLSSSEHIKPPLYVEAVKFIDLLYNVSKNPWSKFKNQEKTYVYPKSNVNWNKYINYESNPQNKLSFPCKENSLTKNHLEFAQIKYVYALAKEELLRPQTPLSLKYEKENLLKYLDKFLYPIDKISTKEIKIHRYDSLMIKNLKTQANKILNRNLSFSIAWRVDFAEVFEKYTQYVFQTLSARIGAQCANNFKFKSLNNNPSWGLSYLEPDIILSKDYITFIVDAKYKSHMYNLLADSDKLKDEHRKDIHQLLAYCSFIESSNKIGILCYPSNQIIKKCIKYHNELNNVLNKVYLLGIPMKKSVLNDLLLNTASCIMSDIKQI